jgi:hypothetical protein
MEAGRDFPNLMTPLVARAEECWNSTHPYRSRGAFWAGENTGCLVVWLSGWLVGLVVWLAVPCSGAIR